MRATSIIRGALAALAPPLCLSCRAWAGRTEPLCADCRRALRPLPDGRFRVAPGLVGFAPVAFDGPARALVHALKFRAALPVAPVMAAQITAGAPDGLLDGALLVPVPLHPSRRRRRGFNQAELLAHALAARSAAVVSDCLERAGGPAAQVGRGRAARLAGPAGAIAMRSGKRAPPAALLVDDVVTTGATLAACAAALRAAGAPPRGAVAYARVTGR